MTGVMAAVFLSGCIFIRTTEHRVRIKPDGSGEALLRLIDIRSDGVSDSLVRSDYDIMLGSLEGEGIKEFEKRGRKVSSKKLFVRGDTLIAEIIYSFASLEAVEGLFITNDLLYIVVGAQREILKTDGEIENWQGSSHRIIWDRDTQRLSYMITEKRLPPSVSLAPLFRLHPR
jgi:hypothetical protein